MRCSCECMRSMRERARGYEVERRERNKMRGRVGSGQRQRRRSEPLLGLEPRSTTTTSHDRTHKREEAVCVFCRRHGTDLVLYIATEKKKISTRADAKRGVAGWCE